MQHEPDDSLRHFSRRQCITQSLAAAGAVLAVGPLVTARAAESGEGEKEVLAAEDLMREHGVLRRALLVYSEVATRISNQQAASVPLPVLRDTATLFRTFGEDYHERSLEEAHVFPVLIKHGGKNATIAGVLKQQHDRGREITDYIAALGKGNRLDDSQAKSLGEILTSFVRMYEHHAAIEDTIVFPAWKNAISSSQYEELSDQFEDLEHRMFGKDGFEDAVQRIARIEEAVGLADLSKLTAIAPPQTT